MAEYVQALAILISLGLVTVVLLYVIVRGASFAYFRTKYEFWHRVRNDHRKRRTTEL